MTMNNVEERYKEYCKLNGIRTKPLAKKCVTKFVCAICDCELNSTGEEKHYKTNKHQNNLRKEIKQEDMNNKQIDKPNDEL